MGARTLRGVFMSRFCLPKVVLRLALAATGGVLALVPTNGVAAGGHHRHQAGEGGEASIAQPSPSTTPAPAAAAAAAATPSQSSDVPGNGAPLGPAGSASSGAIAPADGQQQSDTATGSGTGKTAAGDDGQQKQQPHHHNRGKHQAEDDDDDNTAASATSPQASGETGTAPGIAPAGQVSAGAEGVRKPSAAAGIDAARPPTTVEEWLKRLFNPNGATQTATGKADPAPTAKERSAQASAPAPANPAGVVAATSKPPPKPLRWSRRPVTPAGDFPAAEILIARASPTALQRAEQLGFTQNGTVTLTQSGSLNRLLAPPGVSAEHALAMLNDALPSQRMGINETYHAFHAASEPSDGTTALPMPTECGTDHCFGSNLIGWRPQLQACAKKARIGVIDTSFDREHPAFRKRQIELRPRSLAHIHGDEPEAPNWHGTGVLAILAGEPRSSMPGLIPDGRYLVADVFFADANGLPVSDTASLIEALDWLEERHADIINMSLTGPHDELLQASIERMSRKGVLFIAAVGNDGPTAPPTYPSAYAPVLAVTAINKDLSGYIYANRGAHVDLSAPGVGIWTAMPGGRATYHSGTSFAVPYATAVAAAIFPSLAVKSKAELLRHMTFVDLGPPGPDPIYGRGLVIAPYDCAPGQDAPAGTAAASMPAFITTVVSTTGGKPAGQVVTTFASGAQ